MVTLKALNQYNTLSTNNPYAEFSHLQMGNEKTQMSSEWESSKLCCSNDVGYSGV